MGDALPIVEAHAAFAERLVITDWRGDPLDTPERGRVVAAATPELHAAALERLAGVSAPPISSASSTKSRSGA
ncbi:MAG: hypothetical protein ABL957_02285 [Parvularculaceae bacterium]